MGAIALVLADAEAELGHLAGGVGADQLQRRSLGDDLALVHHHEPVAELLGLVHVVRRQHQRHALLLEPEQPLPDDVAGLRVEAGRRLVEQQHLGPVDQRPRDGEPALHAAGEVLDLGLRLLGELHEVEQLLAPTLRTSARGQAEEAAVDVEVVPDVQLHVEGVLLGAHADARPDLGAVGGGVEPEDAQLAADVTGETAAIIRMVLDLPAPLGPRKPNDSPRRTSTSMPAHGLERAVLADGEGLVQPPSPDHRVACLHVVDPRRRG